MVGALGILFKRRHLEVGASGPGTEQALFWASSARCENRWLVIRPEVGPQVGIETFELSATVPSNGTALTASSRLSYPVATLMAGGTTGFHTGPFSVSGTVLTNIMQPWGTMLDQDFASVGGSSLELSHTDSKASLESLVVEGAMRLRVAELSRQPGVIPLHLVAGFRYEGSTYDINGLTGWQLDPSGTRVSVSLPDDLHALHYEVRYFIPFLGAGLQVRLSRTVVLDAEARAMASASTHDDDHILRNKTAHASVGGAGLGLSAEPALDLGGGPAAHVFVGLSAQLQYLTAVEGRLRQHYYGDDPTIAGNQLGVAIPDAEFSFTSLRARLLAFAAVWL